MLGGMKHKKKPIPKAREPFLPSNFFLYMASLVHRIFLKNKSTQFIATF